MLKKIQTFLLGPLCSFLTFNFSLLVIYFGELLSGLYSLLHLLYQFVLRHFALKSTNGLLDAVQKLQTKEIFHISCVRSLTQKLYENIGTLKQNGRKKHTKNTQVKRQKKPKKPQENFSAGTKTRTKMCGKKRFHRKKQCPGEGLAYKRGWNLIIQMRCSGTDSPATKPFTAQRVKDSEAAA